MSNPHDTVSSSETMAETLFDKTFRDDKGRVVIFQKPNLPVLVGLTTTSLLLLLPNQGSFSAGLEAVAFGSLFTWGWIELFKGVNYFRRSLGLFFLLGLILVKLQW